MPVAPEHRGPWLLIAHRLRFTKDKPPRHDKLVERPRAGRKGNWAHFLDNPDANHGDEPGPTLVTFAADDAVDVPALLRQDALRSPLPSQLPPVKGKQPVKGKPVKGGNDGS